MTRRIRFNAFDMNCVAHRSPGLWRHPDDQSRRYKELGYWTERGSHLHRRSIENGRWRRWSPGSGTRWTRQAVPVTARGAHTEEYVPGTLRDAMFGAGDRLRAEHRDASYRLGGAGSTALPDEVSRAGATAETRS